jgi:hypothetical protein
MELDDLKTAWALLEQRAQGLESLVMRERQERRLEASRRVLLGLSLGQAVQFAIWIAVVATVAPFWIRHRGVSHLLLAGLTLHLYGVVTICATVVQLLLIARTYHTAPVVTFQRRLLELHRFRLMSTLALGVPWFVLWIVATMVGAKWWFDVDLYALSPGWIQVSLWAGIVAIVCSVVVARWYTQRPVKSARLRRIADDLAGLSLVRAARQLDEVARFERSA